MPIKLNNLEEQLEMTQTIISYTPKFFDSKLTGNGSKTQGLLNEGRNPSHIKKDVRTTNQNINMVKRHYSNGQTEITLVPFYLLCADAWSEIEHWPIPDMNTLQHVGQFTNGLHEDIYVGIQAHTLLLEEVSAGYGANGRRSISKTPTICYQPFIWRTYSGAADKENAWQLYNVDSRLKQDSNAYGTYYNGFFTEFTCTPQSWFERNLKALDAKGAKIDWADLDTWFTSLSAYDLICDRAHDWNENVDVIIDSYLENVSEQLAAQRQQYYGLQPTEQQLRQFWERDAHAWMTIVKGTLRNLETYNIPLAKYEDIYASIAKHFDTQRTLDLCKQNLNLLLNATLRHLETNKANLQVMPANANPPAVDPHYSTEQRNAIITNAPLVMVQAGAGTGKALPLDEPVLTPNGWTKMGDLQIGDEVIGQNGKPCQVIKIHEQGLKLGYKLTFRDGSSIRACKEHLWEVRNATNNDQAPEVITTEEFINRDDISDLYIPQMKAVGGKHIAFGASCNSLGTAMAKSDDWDEAKKLFVSKEWFIASIPQRTLLVNGIFDARGTVQNGCAQYATHDEQIANTVCQLLWSLGVSAQITDTDNQFTVTVLDQSFNPFGHPELHEPVTGPKEPMRRSLVKWEEIEPVPMRCIEVDSDDHLYVAKDYIVTHNSTTILARIKYMTDYGIDPHDIMVLSFTNAAADHINEKNPNVHSMTIAKMIHTIYTENFPDHELSTVDTLINSLDIYYPNDDFAYDFKGRLLRIRKGENDCFTRMNNFVERNYDQVIQYLDTMKQTCLELESIICYQKIDVLKEPLSVHSKYLIIDEVQDNSIFEFIYTLKYVDKHQESLFIVGKLQLPTLNPTNCGKPTHSIVRNK